MLRLGWLIAVTACIAGCGEDGGRSRLRGAVVDPGRKPVAGATVTVGGVTMTTDARGTFKGRFDGVRPTLVEVSAPGYFMEKLEGPNIHFACDPEEPSDCAIARHIEIVQAPAVDGIFVLAKGTLVPVAVKTLTHDGTSYAIGDAEFVTLPRSNGNLLLYVRGAVPAVVRQVQGTPPAYGEPRAPVFTRTRPITGGGEGTVIEFSLPNYPDARWALGSFADQPDAPGTVVLDGHRAVLFKF